MSDVKLRVLAIDDEPAINLAIKKAVETSNHEVISTADIAEFKRALETWRPGVVITDVNMPGCDGVELLHYLADVRCTAPIYVSSGLDDGTLDAVVRIGSGLGLNMAGKLAKPMRLADLQQALQRHLVSDAALGAEELAQAIARSELYLEYQPVADLKLNKISGVEALVRWKHPRRGPLPPDQFLGLTEQAEGLGAALTDWVVSHAAQQMVVWQRQGLALEVAVNISPSDTRDNSLPDRLLQLCANHLANPNSLTLETSETSAMADMAQMMDVLTRLRVKGFKISIDDFGAGCSSLVQLQQLPFSDMKIDRSFVGQMAQSRDCAVIVEIVIDLARKLNRRCVAKGVENQPTLDQLARLGCGAAQGFFISPPVGPERIIEFVRSYGLGRMRVAG